LGGDQINISKLNDWLQLIATVGVILGIVFVAEELRQNNQLTRAQSVRDLYMEWQNIYRFEHDNDIDSLICKSAEQGEALTDREIRRLDNHFNMIMGAQLAQVSMQQRFGLAYYAIDEARSYAEDYYSSPFGRAWFYENQGFAGYEGSEYLDALNRAVESIEVQSEGEYLKRLKSRLK